MSVTIHWKPTSKAEKYFNSGTSSALKIILEHIGEVITPHDVDTLRAMAAASNDGFYSEVADVVQKYGEIRIWGEY